MRASRQPFFLGPLQRALGSSPRLRQLSCLLRIALEQVRQRQRGIDFGYDSVDARDLGLRLGNLLLQGHSVSGLVARSPVRSIADALFKTILEKDVASAVKQYREMKAGSSASEYDFGEMELNRLGYRLLSTRKVAEAIEIFKLNVESFPQASNVYDSLGEAYMLHGDKELAIANYKRSLELDPQNKNATAKLTTLTTERKEVKVDAKVYDSYAGEYQLGSAFTITITNTGTVSFPLSGVGITGANAGDFSETNDCPSPLAVSASCHINVVFTPSAAGTRTASVVVSVDSDRLASARF